MLTNRPKGLIIPIIKPTQNNKIKLQPKCRFCENLNPWLDRGEFDDVVMCFEMGVVDKGNVDEVTECPEFKWVDELKEVIK